MKKTAGLYDPYLDTLGGGEKYILSILQVLNDEGYEITIFWNDKNILKKIKKTFLLQFNIKLEQVDFFRKKSFPFSTLKTWQTLKTFDYFFYVTDGSYFFSSAKKNFIYAMVPQQNLYNMNLLNRLKTYNTSFISHSKFTQNWLKQWGIESKLLYPYIALDQFSNTNKKENIILSVGRFFEQLHSKRQDLAIDFFKRLKKQNPQFSDYKLILAGGLKKEDQSYYLKIKKPIINDPSIALEPNISYDKLINLYQKAKFYWHFAGYGIDEEKNPELVEHLGITPLEAMASGTIPFCYQAGGPKELIRDGINGFLFKTERELIDKMSKIINDENLQSKIKQSAYWFIKDNFSYEMFKKNVFKILNI